MQIENYFNSEEFYSKIYSLYSKIKSDTIELDDIINYFTSLLIKYYLLFKEDKGIVDLDNFLKNIINICIELSENKKDFSFNSYDLKIAIDDFLKKEFEKLNINDNLEIYKYIIKNLNKDYIFHAFNSLNYDSIKKFGIDPAKKNIPEDEINEINEIFVKHGVNNIFGWLKLNCENKVFYSKTPNVSYSYAVDSPEWFSQFVGGATVYGRDGNYNFSTNNYNKAYRCIKKVMQEKNFSNEECVMALNFFNKYWKVYSNKKPMLFIKEAMKSELKEKSDKDIYEIIYNDIENINTLKVQHCIDMCLNPFFYDSATTKVITPENSEIIELTEFSKIYEYVEVKENQKNHSVELNNKDIYLIENYITLKKEVSSINKKIRISNEKIEEYKLKKGLLYEKFITSHQNAISNYYEELTLKEKEYIEIEQQLYNYMNFDTRRVKEVLIYLLNKMEELLNTEQDIDLIEIYKKTYDEIKENFSYDIETDLKTR